MSALHSTDAPAFTAKEELLTQEEANRIINKIQQEQGYLSDEKVQFLESAPEGREIRKNYDRLRLKAIKLVNSTTTLNSNDAHFIPELLQNADDANYSSALKKNEQPWIRFRVMQDRITLETNEDGFSRKDVEAICETHASSKRHSKTQHIGEKGIGFKSIFRVAEKVEIDSGLWHFHFNHFDDDDGLGMVTPLLHEPMESLETNGTRITIHLNARYRGKRGNNLRESFRTLPDTTIFFLRKISRIEIVIDTEVLTETTTVTMAHSKPSGRSTLSKSSSIASSSASTQELQIQKETLDVRFYQTFSSGKLKMPKDKNRNCNTATILLAFPVDSTSTSAVLDTSGEHVFAYLPMYRKSQLKFLIQSDFITTASRETAEDCDWNEHLIKATAKTFCQAVEYFCRQNTLRYEWLKFIPTEPINGDWAYLSKSIIAGLKQRQVFATSYSSFIRAPHQVCRIPKLFKHNKVPLLRDLPGDDEVHLDEEYERYPVTLGLLDVPWLSTSAILDRLESDLDRPESKFRSAETSPHWHEALSLWMLSLYGENSNVWCKRLESMQIIPLESSTWTSASLGPDVHQRLRFPAIDDVKVPRGLRYTLLDAEATTHPTRKRLLQKMGVATCKVPSVLKQIKKVHSKPDEMTSLSSVDHLYFCYHSAANMVDMRYDMWVVTESGHLKRLYSEIYLPDGRNYSTSHLTNILASDFPDRQPMYDMWLLDSLYVEDRWIDQPARGCSWRKWLGEQAGIKEIPALMVPDDNGRFKLSSVLQEVLSVSSSLFLETLQAHWTCQYSTDCMNSEHTLNCLQRCQLECENGTKACLRDIYLPCDEVTVRARELGVDGKMAIVKLPSVETSLKLNDWMFLQQLGIRTKIDVEFHLQALGHMDGNHMTEAVIAYDYIGANAKKSEADGLAERFKNERLICAPSNTGSPSWCSLSNCVWEGPAVLTVKKPIGEYYQQNGNATYLFRNLLEIRDANWHDLLGQLRYAKADKGAEFSVEQASDIYLELNAMKGVNWELLRRIFIHEQLVFVSRLWFSPDTCLWSSSVKIDGRPILGMYYSKLESFFTHRLKVQKAQLSQVVRELARKAKSPARLTPWESTDFLIHISSMMATEDNEDDSLTNCWDELVHTPFLPVRCGTEEPRLVDCFSPFVIGDSYEYNQAFVGQCAFLDLSFEEIPRVSRVLRALPLEMNWLSEIVEETSVVQGNSIRNEALTLQFQRKAAYLFSCAYKYHCPRADNYNITLFEELRNISVYTCSTIATKLVLDFEGIDAQSMSEGAQVVLEKQNDKLSLFVPENQKKRRSSFRSSLPSKLLELWEIEDDRAWTCLVLILTNDLSDMDDVMKTENLPRVLWLDPEAYGFSSDDSDQEASSPTLASEGSPSDARGYTTSQLSQAAYPRYNVLPERQSVRARGRTSVSLDPDFLPATHVGSDYKALLHQIVMCARSKGSTMGDFNDSSNDLDLSSLSDILPTLFDTTSVFGSPGIERNFRIGAAGELYVFERLKKLGLPDFGISNWRSRIRKYVTPHPEYAGTANWDGRETADIVYQDRSGKMQQWLRRVSCNGFPELVEGANRSVQNRRTYYLEVKTTILADCDTEFYMSQGEYDLMNRLQIGSGRDPDEIYVIIRVFKLTDYGIAFRVFVDPCRCRAGSISETQVPRLRFEVGKWDVYPSTGGLAYH